jgi:hypothetical protein
MSKFVPRNRGYGNPIFKDPSVREYENMETKLFDLYHCSGMKSTLADSIIDLRDMQMFVIETMVFLESPVATDDVCPVIHQGFEYFFGLIDKNDAENLRLKSAGLLKCFDIKSIYDEMAIAKANIATLININLAVMKTYTRRMYEKSL